MQFVRAPDENVYIPPFNVIEVFLLAIPLEWWMRKKTYERLNDVVMFIIYSPLLVVAAYFETRTAADIVANRKRGDEDDDTVEEWEQMASELDLAADGWQDKVASARSNVEDEPTVVEVRRLRDELHQMQELMTGMANLLQVLAKEKGVSVDTLPQLTTGPTDEGEVQDMKEGKKPDNGEPSSSSGNLLD